MPATKVPAMAHAWNHVVAHVVGHVAAHKFWLVAAKVLPFLF